MRAGLLVAMVALAGVGACFATTAEQDTSIMAKAPKVFIDCRWCDMDYIREQIPYVNYVRDRFDAQVHVLITSQRTGSGGEEFTLAFIGKKEFEGKSDTLRYVVGSTATEDEIRAGIVRTLKLGLVPYVARTPVADLISIRYAPGAKTTEVTDKWKNWVFQISLHTFGSGEKSSRSTNLYGSLSASRVTPDWKIRFSLSGSYNENRFEYGPTKVFSYTRSKRFRALVVRSLGEHWSAGVRAGYESSTYNNLDWQFYFTPAFEFNVLPYSQSTHRELRIQYGLGGQSSRYLEETIFYKMREDLLSHYLSVTLTFKQPWGSTETTIRTSQYLHDLAKNRLMLWNEIRVRLFGGLSVSLFGSISRIRDQISLPRRGASTEEVLLRRRQLATNYSYFVSFGITYTFGSIYTNVVNPRFGSGGMSYRIIIG